MKMTLLILALFLAPALASAQSPSLGDIARKERARQKTVTSDTTFTNDTIETPAPEPPPAPKDKAAPEPPKPAATSTTGAVHDEAWWRDAFMKARDEVKRSEDRQKVLQLELNKLNMDMLTRDDIFNREAVLGPQIDAKNSELAAAEMQAEQARQRVMQLEEDLRHAGAPAGWAR